MYFKNKVRVSNSVFWQIEYFVWDAFWVKILYEKWINEGKT